MEKIVCNYLQDNETFEIKEFKFKSIQYAPYIHFQVLPHTIKNIEEKKELLRKFYCDSESIFACSDARPIKIDDWRRFHYLQIIVC